MASLNKIFYSVPWPEKQIDRAWRTLMLSQSHDCWIVPYNGKPGYTWADKVKQWTDSSNRIADHIISGVFDQIQGKPAGDNRYVCVFNTLAVSRTDLVSIPLPSGFNPSTIQVFASNGKAVTSQVIQNENTKNLLVFRASVPSMGYSTFRLVKENVHTQKIEVRKLINGIWKVETNYYTALIDPAKGGTITSLLAKKMGNVQLVEKGQTINNLKGYFYNEGRFYSGSAERAKVTVVDDGPLILRLKVESQLDGNPYCQMITFKNDHPRIDFELTIDWKKNLGIGAYSQQDSYKSEDYRKAFYNDKYKLQVQFPLKGVSQHLYKNTPFDVCESKLKDTYSNRWDSIKNNVILNWVNVEDSLDSHGVALFTDHTTSYIHSPNLALGLTVQYVGKGLWGRNYTLKGPTQIRYSLLPHTNRWDQYGIDAESMDWNEPLQARMVNVAPFQSERSFVKVESKGLEVISMVTKEDDLYVKLFNAENDQKDKEITLNCTDQKIEMVDLNGRVIRLFHPELTPDRLMKLKLAIPRFGLITLKLTQVKTK
jgi:alpha-mannosidase